MISANLIINNKPYTSGDTIGNTIHYIYRLDNPYKFYYGIYPPTPKNAITIFYQVQRLFPQNTCDQQVQHLIISFDNSKDISLINDFSNQIACIFSEFYPVCLALHDDKEHLHTHFIISTASYIPNTPPLTMEKLNAFIPVMEQLASIYHISLKKVTKNV